MIDKDYEPPTPNYKTKYTTVPVHVDVEFERFDVQYGYKGRDSIQVRLEDTGRIFLSDTKFSNTEITTVDFETFEEEFHKFFKVLKAKEDNKKGN